MTVVEVHSASLHGGRVLLLATSRSILPKYTSASAGFISHNARPNRTRTRADSDRCTRPGVARAPMTPNDLAALETDVLADATIAADIVHLKRCRSVAAPLRRITGRTPCLHQISRKNEPDDRPSEKAEITSDARTRQIVGEHPNSGA
jgi:hypothetical protein